MFVWLGDATYLDRKSEEFLQDQPKYYRKRLQNTENAPGYHELQEVVQRIVGTWDDHDYGKNDAGRHLAEKNSNREAYLDFLGEPSDSERRVQQGTPIH